jgi:Na+-driven multidrug efflux pump
MMINNQIERATCYLLIFLCGVMAGAELANLVGPGNHGVWWTIPVSTLVAGIVATINEAN